jgi:hypothetical protein
VAYCRLAAGLFFDDRKSEPGDSLDLMAVRPRRHLFDKRQVGSRR